MIQTPPTESRLQGVIGLLIFLGFFFRYASIWCTSSSGSCCPFFFFLLVPIKESLEKRRSFPENKAGNPAEYFSQDQIEVEFRFPGVRSRRDFAGEIAVIAIFYDPVQSFLENSLERIPPHSATTSQEIMRVLYEINCSAITAFAVIAFSPATP